ncbi:MAG TPA: DinB family protein [Phycisphaerae bacterium]
MTVNDYLAASLMGSLGMLKMTIADMSDADLLMRPVPGANHPNWQIGHLIAAETGMMSQLGAKMPELPAGFAELYSKETAKIDDASKFATKDALMAQFEKTRSASAAFAQTMTAAQLAAPSPFAQFFPTNADFVGLGAQHIAMHLGQIQVLRRKLGKPILF